MGLDSMNFSDIQPNINNATSIIAIYCDYYYIYNHQIYNIN